MASGFERLGRTGELGHRQFVILAGPAVVELAVHDEQRRGGSASLLESMLAALVRLPT